MIPSCSDREESCVGLEIRGINNNNNNNNNNNVKLSHFNPSYLLKPSQLYTLSSTPAPQKLALCKLSLLKTVKVHLTPKFFFGRDETVQHSHKEFDNFISILFFKGFKN